MEEIRTEHYKNILMKEVLESYYVVKVKHAEGYRT
jgi:hypothetical protein